MSKTAQAMLEQRELVTAAKRKAKPISPQELDQIMEDPKTSTKYKLLSVVMFFAAARVSEVIGLQWSAIDWERGTITRPILKGTKGHRITIKGARKNNPITSAQRNKISLPQFALEMIAEYRQDLGNPEPDAFMFPNNQGWHLSKQAVSKALEKMASRQGWEGQRVSSHSFRRGWATYAITVADYSPQQAMQVTGHKSQVAFYEYVDILGT